MYSKRPVKSVSPPKLNGHTDAVYSILKLNKNMIVSSSGKTWRLWDLTRNFNPEDVENLDDNVVGKLNKSMVVSSSGKTWRLWDLTKTFNPEDVENLDENVGRLTMR